MQKLSPVLPETNFCLCNFFEAPQTGLQRYRRKICCPCNFAPHTEPDKQKDEHTNKLTYRPTEDRKSLGEHFSYAKMVSGVTGDKLFVFATFLKLSKQVSGVIGEKFVVFATLF